MIWKLWAGSAVFQLGMAGVGIHHDNVALFVCGAIFGVQHTIFAFIKYRWER